MTSTVARVTAKIRRNGCYEPVPDIVISNSWRDRVEDLLGDRRDALLTAAVLVGTVVVATLFWMRGAPPKIAPPARPTGAPIAAASPTAVAEGTLFVHVAGAVRRPGLYELPEGARVADAIEAAGGARSGADLGLLNLAESLVDGAKVDVLKRGDQPAAASVDAASSGGTSVINVNTADTIALETIPGIGPVTAAAIITYRESSGPFESVEDLLDVEGIGPATLESLRPYVTV